MIGLIDANNFYASCERVFRPDLLNRPVAILSNNDGCIIARSAEVKALGVPMGAPYFQVKKILAAARAAVFSSNFSLYGDMSGRMMNLIGSLVPRLEVYSIDEAFIDFSGIRDIKSLAAQVGSQVAIALGLPTCIGISRTKTLAKVASYMAKKHAAYKSVCMLAQEKEIDDALKELSVGEIWGIGRRLTGHLNGFGVYTGLDLKHVDPRWMRRHFTVTGERLVQELNGISCLSLEEAEPARKSIQVSRSFARPVSDFEELKEIMATYATRLGEKLRNRGLKAQSLLVNIRTDKHQRHILQHCPYTTIIPDYPVADDFSLIKASATALTNIYKEGIAYRKAGIMAAGLIPKDQQVQMDFFSASCLQGSRHAQLFEALDQVNKRYGKGTLFSAACGTGIEWKDQKSCLSPAYTTRWSDVPIVFAR